MPAADRWIGRFAVLIAAVGAAACDGAPPGIVGDIRTGTPNASTPLAAVVSFETSEPALIAAEVSAAGRQWSLPTSGEPATIHSVPIVGMYPATAHTVTLTLRDQTGNPHDVSSVTIDTPALPESFPPIDLVASDPSRMEPGYTLMSVFRWLENRPSNEGLLVVVDERGQVVWYHRADHRISDVRQTERGTLLYQFDRGAVELDMLGNVLARWHAVGLGEPAPDGAIPVDVDTFHHEIVDLPTGGMLTLGTEVRTYDDYPSSETDPSAPRGPANVVGDVVVEFERDGTITRSWKLLDILDPYRIGYKSLWGFFDRTDYAHIEGGTKDWSHGNAVIHDPADDSLILSVRHQAAVVKIDRLTGRIVWILGDPAGWGETWQRYLLKPDGPLEWAYYSHAPMLTPDGTLLVYDNGNYRAMPFETPVEAADNYSRAVEFSIDADAMTVRQVWSYGGPGSEMSYTPFLGDADWLPDTGNVLVTEGGHVVDEQGVPLNESTEGRKWARIVEVTHTSPPEKVFELLVGGDEAPGWTVYRSDRVARLH